MPDFRSLIPLILFIQACTGGTSSGGDIFSDCFGLEGTRTYSGIATSFTGQHSGPISVTLTLGTDCDITGAAVYEPCVPVTAVKGKGSPWDFEIETLDGALRLAHSEIVLPSTPGESPPNGTYEFSNVNDIPNCPASDTGSHTLQRVEGV